jgi:hypothetical protein
MACRRRMDKTYVQLQLELALRLSYNKDKAVPFAASKQVVRIGC